MDHRRALIGNMEILQTLITAEDSNQFVEYLFKREMVSFSELKTHQEYLLTMDKVKNMIRLLVGPKHHQMYQAFRVWLADSHMSALLAHFPSDQRPKSAGDSSPPPPRDALHSDLEDGEEDSESLLTGKLVSIERPRPTLTTDPQVMASYPVNQGSPGTALLVVNEKFPRGNSGFTKRSGADLDLQHLNSLFTWLGYRVRILNNASLADFIAQITQIRLDSNHYKDSSFVLAISSVGQNNSVYMADGRKIKLSEIYDLIDGNSFPSMSGKPKLIYIDLVLPEVKSTDFLEEGIPVTLTTSPKTLASGTQQPIKIIQSTLEPESPIIQIVSPAEIISNARVSCKSDFVIVMSSFPGFNSFHNGMIGSLATLVLCDTIYKYCDREPCLALLRRARRRLLNPDLAKSSKQTLTTFETLTKRFYLVPSADGTAV